MMKNALIITALLLTQIQGAYAVAGTSQHFETCRRAALDARPGDVIKVEYRDGDSGHHVYEFDIRGLDGSDWDVACDAQQGVVVEIEHEVSTVNHPLFKSKAKVSEAQARKTALAAYPGVIVEIEYEVESDGTASYEFDIDTNIDNEQMKVEVDATSGKIVEANRELWQIGLE